MGEKNLETKAMRAARERREMQRYPKVNVIACEGLNYKLFKGQLRGQGHYIVKQEDTS